MRFISDENFRKDVIARLERMGHDVRPVPRACSDRQVSALARKEKRIILTNDGDFAMTLQFPPREHFGILVFRIHPPKYEHFNEALESFLKRYNTATVKGRTFVIDRGGFMEIE